MNRWLCIGLSAVLLFALTACQGEEGVSSGDSEVELPESTAVADILPEITTTTVSTETSTTNSQSETTVPTTTGTKATAKTTTKAVTTQKTTSTTTKPQATVLELFKEGKSFYTLVYDDSDPVITEQVLELQSRLKDRYEVQIECVAASKAKTDYGREIVVGNVRPSVAVVANKLKDSNDFGVFVQEDDLVLYATNSYLYRYLFQMAQVKYFSNISAGSLQVSSDDPLIYHDSNVKDLSYVEYLKKIGGVSLDTILKIFEARTHTGADGTVLSYRVYVPAEYDPRERYPLFLLLHGSGERGSDNVGNVRYMVAGLFNQADSPVARSIVICPQCPEGSRWVNNNPSEGNYDLASIPESSTLKAVLEIIEAVETEFSVDSDRRYVMGLSMGGFGTWDLLMRHPDLFAAGVPICGGADPTMASVLKHMPIYTVHGSADSTVPVKGTRAMVKALKEAGSTVIQYEELYREGHGVGGYVETNTDIVKWLYAQKRSAHGAD
ncbi:MAG: prolyl oligopeptidase family serine peptidase [Clostridia bacterium]|nr:prolyl oligopeptidase family serine peptidase [Clostridia bacterium]